MNIKSINNTDFLFSSEDRFFNASVCFNVTETTWGYYVYCYAGDDHVSSNRYDTREEAHAAAEVWVKAMEAVA